MQKKRDDRKLGKWKALRNSFHFSLSAHFELFPAVNKSYLPESSLKKNKLRLILFLRLICGFILLYCGIIHSKLQSEINQQQSSNGITVYMKMTLLLRLSAAVFLLASVALNVHFLTAGKKPSEPPAAIMQEPNGKTDAKEEKKKLHWKHSSYDAYEKRVNVRFNTNEDVLLTEKDIRITPALSFHLANTYGGFAVSGDFKPETQYSFLLKKGIRDKSGKTLGYDAAFKVWIPQMRTSVKFLSEGPYFPRGRRNTILPLELVNVDKLTISLSKYYKNNLPAFHLNSWEGREKLKEISSTEQKVDIPKNSEVNYPLNLAPVIRNLEPGVYRLGVSAEKSGKDNAFDSASINIVISDLSLQCVTDAVGRRAFGVVRKLSDNTAVQGAKVELWSRKNQKIGEGMTGADGIARVDYSVSFNDRGDVPAMFLAEKDGDLTFCNLDKVHDLAEKEAAVNIFSDMPRALLYTERGVCRPGETVTASLFLRNSNLEAVKGTPLLLTLADPAGRELKRTELKTDDYGFASVRLQIPANGKTGTYGIQVSFDGKEVLGSTRVIVSNYMPDRIKVDLKEVSTRQRCGAETPLDFAVRSSYYFGADTGSAPYTFTVCASGFYTPDFWRGYAVGDTKDFLSGRPYLISGTLEKGSARVAYPGFAAQGGKAYLPVRLHVSAQVNEPGGRAVTAKDMIVCHPTDYYFGLKYPDNRKIRDRTAEIQWKLLPADAKHQLKASADFRYKLYRQEWNYVLRRSRNRLKRIWELEQQLVREGTVKSNMQSGTLELKDLSAGYYEIVAEDSVRRTRMDFWHSAGDGGGRTSNPAVLVFRTDRTVYQPGETALVTFRSPGKGHAFIATGGRELDSMQSVEVKAGENTIAVRIPQTLQTSSCFSGITLLSGEQRSFGLLTLNIDQHRHRLDITLTAPETAAPSETVTIEAKLTGSDNMPVESLVHLYAVDAGILSLTNYQVPDIFGFFYGNYRCPYRFSDIFDSIFPDLRIGRDGRIGGDKEMSPAYGAPSLKNADGLDVKKAAIIVLDAVRTDKDGRIKADVKLPEHTGALRIMAVASSHDKVGSVSRELILRDKVTIMTSVPRAVAPGDEFELTFTIFNHEIPDITGTLAVALPEKFRISGSSQCPVEQLKRGKSTVCKFKVRADGAAGTYSVRAKLNAWESGTSLITVRNANPPVTQTGFHMVKPGEKLKIALKKEDWADDTVKMEIKTSASPALAASKALAFLNRYPYGCLEQTAAGAFPLLAADTLKKVGLLTETEAQSVVPKLESAAASILSMMLYNGSFSMWPGGETAWESASVFVSHFLFEAAERDLITLDSQVKNRINAYLYSIASDASKPRGIRAYATYVLALGGHTGAVRNAQNLLAGAAPDFATFLAGAALIRANYAGEGGEAVTRAMNAEVWRENNMPYEFADEACRCGMTLSILSEIMPESPHALKLAEALRRKLRPDDNGWGTTHANAWGILGLSAYAARMGSGISQGRLVCSSGKTADIDTTVRQTFRLSGNESAELVNTGNAPIYVQTTSTGIPKRMRTKEGALKLSKVYLNEKGKVVTEAKHGELVMVCWTLEASGPVENVVISDLLPGGLEIEDDLLATRAGAVKQQNTGKLRLKYVEKGEDRFLFFGDILDQGRITFRYRTRAVTRGKYAVPPLHAEAMYAPDTGGTFAGGGMLVVD